MKKQATLILSLVMVLLFGCATQPWEGPPPDPAPAAPAPIGPVQAGPDPVDCTTAPTTVRPAPGQVAVFFTCAGDTLPAPPRGVLRDVPVGETPLRVALEELLKGPSAGERAAGYTSHFSDKTVGMLNSVTVTATGRAVVNFADLRDKMNNASTSAGAAQLIGELRSTIFQFTEVREVEFTINGSCHTFWNWLQADCQVLGRPGGGAQSSRERSSGLPV